MSFIIYILYCVSSIELKDGQGMAEIISIDNSQTKNKIEIAQSQTKRIVNYKDSKNTIGLSIINTNQKNEDLCIISDRNIVFDDFLNNNLPIMERAQKKYENYNGSHKYDRFEDVNDPNYYVNNPILTGMVRTIYGYAIVTSNHSLFMIELANQEEIYIEKKLRFDFAHLRQNVFETSLPQLLYNREQYQLYIVFKQQIILCSLSSNNVVFTNSNISITNTSQYIDSAKIHRGHIFVVQGKNGFSIYKIKYDMDLEFKQNVIPYHISNNSVIKDITFGGNDNKYLFVLDNLNGIFIYEMIFDSNDNIILRLTSDLPISIQGGFFIASKERVLMVMCEQISYNVIIELDIYLDKNLILKMKNHTLDGKYFDLVIEDQFAVVRGVDAHLIIYHSVWSGFEPYYNIPVTMEQWYEENNNELDTEEYLMIPQAQSFLIISNMISKFENNNNIVQHNVTHPYIVSITTHKFAVMRFLEVNPYIECKLPDQAEVGDVFTITVELNSTWCIEKLQKIILTDLAFPSLVMCNKKEAFDLVVVEDLKQGNNERQLYVTLIAGSIICMFFLIYVGLKFYQCYKNRKVRLDEQLNILGRRGYQIEENAEGQVSGF